MRHLFFSLVLIFSAFSLVAGSMVAIGGEEPVITEITVIPSTVEVAASFREGNLTCMEARAALQGVVGEYFKLDEELDQANTVSGFMDEPTQLRLRADFLEKISEMGDRMSLSWIDCLAACEGVE